MYLSDDDDDDDFAGEYYETIEDSQHNISHLYFIETSLVEPFILFRYDTLSDLYERLVFINKLEILSYISISVQVYSKHHIDDLTLEWWQPLPICKKEYRYNFELSYTTLAEEFEYYHMVEINNDCYSILEKTIKPSFYYDLKEAAVIMLSVARLDTIDKILLEI